MKLTKAALYAQYDKESMFFCETISTFFEPALPRPTVVNFLLDG
jgi:hypothetical protein